MDRSKKRVVLGLNAYSHDAGAALVVDGELVFAAEQERYDRKKHSAAFPAQAIGSALSHAGLVPGDIDAVAFCWRRDMARWRKALYFLARLPRSLPFLTQVPEGLPPRREYLESVKRLPNDLRAAGITAPVHYVEHHRAHAQQALLFGPSDDAAIITADGMGEWTATATWDGTRALRRRNYPHSLGKFYAAITQHLGFKPDSGEGKTMGLAPYADGPDPRVLELVRPHPKRLYDIDLKRFAFPYGHTRMAGKPFEAVFGPPEQDPRLARGAQVAVEEALLAVARQLREETGRTHLGLAGGLFLNCVLNGRLLRESGFESLFVFPAAGDAGAAAGAAAEVAGMPRRPLDHAFLGDRFDIPDGIGATRVEDPAQAAAEALADGKIVGWFTGRMEFGPRALGARSILADPRIRDIRDRLNHTVKFREDFRPFAPAVLEEEAQHWFVDAQPSPFMLLTFQAKAGVAERVPGVVHVDGSARVQTVGPQGPLRGVLERFFRLTGVPMVLNTSFNLRGEPIVRTPREALSVFRKGAMDLLVLEDRIVSDK